MVEAVKSKSIEVNKYGVNSNSTNKADVNDKSFIDYINTQYKNYENSKAKSVDQNKSIASDKAQEDYSEILSDLKDNINTLKNDYEIANKASSIADKASANKKINDDLKKLDNTLNKVEKIVGSDKSISKTDLTEVKDLVNNIPKAALNKTNINDKKVNILEFISMNVNDDNSDNNAVNMAENLVEDSINSIDETKDVSESDDDVKDDTITNEQALQALQNILDSLKNSENIDAESLSNIKEQLDELTNSINNSNFNIEDLKKMSSDINEILQMLEPVQNTEELTKITDALKEMQSNLNTKIEETVTQKSEVISELSKTNVESSNKTDIHKFSQGNREDVQDTSTSEDVSDSDAGTSSNSNSSSSNANNTEESILNSIINGNNNNNMINRYQTLDTFEATLNNAKVQEPVINESSMASDIVSSIRYMDVKGIEELTVKLNPRELGQVVINIIREGDAMKAQIKASSRETYELLMRNSEDLKKYLGEQNLKVQDVEITFTNDTSYSKNNSFLGESDNNNSNSERNNRTQNETSNELYDDTDEEEEDDLMSNINMLV